MPQEQTDLQKEILRLLDQHQILRVDDIADTVDEPAISVDLACFELRQQDRIQHLGHGQYQKTDQY